MGELVSRRLREDAELRDALHALIDSFAAPATISETAVTETQPPPSPDAPAPSDTAVSIERSELVAVVVPPRIAEAPVDLSRLTFPAARSTPLPDHRPSLQEPGVAGYVTREQEATQQDAALPALVERMRLRSGRLRQPVTPNTDWPDFPDAAHDERELVAANFDNVAASLKLIKRLSAAVPRTDDRYKSAVGLLAESLSALRVSLERLGERRDPDQYAVFQWINRETKTQNIFIARHMKLDDPSEPDAHADLARRIVALGKPLDDDELRKRSLSHVRYHVEKLGRGAGDDDEQLRHWQVIIDKVAELVRGGLPPSNGELRELLGGVIDSLPDALEAPPEFERVVRELDRYIAAQESAGAPPSPSRAETYSPAVAKVRAAIAGRTLVIIGGEARRHSIERLKDAFGLADVDWIASRVHESHYNFEPSIRRPEVVAVLLLIRFISHSFAEVQEFCIDAGKPVIRIRAGYHPNAVAEAIIEQAGDRLGMERTAGRDLRAP